MLKTAKVLLIAALIPIFWVEAYAQKERVTLTLQDAITEAQDQSPAAMSARLSFLQSYWQYRSYKAQFLPSLNLVANIGNYNRSLMALQDPQTGEINYVTNDNLNNRLSLSVDQNIPLTGGTVSLFTSLHRLDQFSPKDILTFNSQPINITLSQPLNAYNRLKWEKRTEPQKYEKAKREYLELVEGIGVTVADLYFQIISLQKTIDLKTKNIENSELLYAIALERFKLGTENKNNLMQMEVRILNQKLELNDSRTNLETMLLKFRSFLGYNDNVDLILKDTDIVPSISIDPEDVYQRAKENSSYIMNQEILITEAQQDVAKNKANNGIQATLSAQFGLTQKGDNLSTAFRNPMDQEIVSLGLRMPIVDWGLGKGKVKMARSREELVRSNAEQAVRDFKQDIYIKVARFNNQRIQCEISAKADSLAGLRYENARERFRNGTITVTDLNNAQTEKDEAALRYLKDLGNYWNYFYTIRKLALYDYITNKKIGADYEKIIDNQKF